MEMDDLDVFVEDDNEDDANDDEFGSESES
jgi:hypothetical protein